MPRFHVVRITSQGYHRLASFLTFDEAKQDAMKRSLNSGPVVVRDGTSGKRFCIEELKAA